MSNNSDIPVLVRGRRFSYAVLNGRESIEELELLAKDVFLYFGLGCRSVNLLLVPQGYDFSYLIKAFSRMRTVVDSSCYINCYKRAKAIAIMEGENFIDGGFFLLKSSDNFYPSIAEISYIYYDTDEYLASFEANNKEQIQKKYCTFGIAQSPMVDDYADNVDTINFILHE